MSCCKANRNWIKTAANRLRHYGALIFPAAELRRRRNPLRPATAADPGRAGIHRHQQPHGHCRVQKAEGLIAAGQKPAAAELLRIKQIAPGSSIRVAAQYDAAVLLLGNQQWQPAISELEELRRHYPQHELAAEFPRKLAFGYEQAGRLKDAAALYLYLYRNDQDETVKRDALFATAGLHEKTGRAAEALEFYKTWARNYEQPFDNRMEARYRIAVIYDQQQDMARKLFLAAPHHGRRCRCRPATHRPLAMVSGLGGE